MGGVEDGRVPRASIAPEDPSVAPYAENKTFLLDEQIIKGDPATRETDERSGRQPMVAARLGRAAASARHAEIANATPDDWYTDDPVEAFAHAVQAIPMLSAEETAELAARAQLGDQAARNRLVAANLRLVIYVARHYAGRGIPMEDLIAAGYSGLIAVAPMYDLNRGATFGTYVIWRIRQAIARSDKEDKHAVHIPDFAAQGARDMQRAADAFAVANDGRTPTDAELADEMGVTQSRLATYRAAQAVLRGLVSLDQPPTHNGEAGEETLGDLLPSEAEADAPDYTVLHKRLQQLLTTRELQVVGYRFGFGGSGETLVEVGERLGVTRERVRQIEKEALGKLKKGLAGQENSLCEG